jgi:putative transposase
VRRVVYTTNAIKSVHGRLRKIIKTRGHFLSKRRCGQQAHLAGLAQYHCRLGKISEGMAPGDEQLSIPYGDRFTRPTR